MAARRPIVIQTDGSKSEMTLGDTIPFDALPPGVGVGSSSFHVRSDEIITTAAIPPYTNSIDYSASMGYAWRMYQLTSTKYCRVRLYSTIDQRRLDLVRPIGIDPDLQSGLLLDFVLLPDTIYTMSPVVDGVNLDLGPSFDTPMTITNLLNIYSVVQVSFKFIRAE